MLLIVLVAVKIRIGRIYLREIGKGEINPSSDLTLLVSPGEFRITENLTVRVCLILNLRDTDWFPIGMSINSKPIFYRELLHQISSERKLLNVKQYFIEKKR